MIRFLKLQLISKLFTSLVRLKKHCYSIFAPTTRCSRHSANCKVHLRYWNNLNVPKTIYISLICQNMKNLIMFKLLTLKVGCDVNYATLNWSNNAFKKMYIPQTLYKEKLSKSFAVDWWRIQNSIYQIPDWTKRGEQREDMLFLWFFIYSMSEFVCTNM